MEQLENKEDKRVEFILLALKRLQEELAAEGSSLLVLQGKPLDVYQNLLIEYSIKNVYTNHDYEPYAIARDKSISDLLNQNQIPFYSYKDQVIFEKSEITKDDGKPYTVFTPYMRKWKSKLNDFYLKAYPCKKYFSNFLKCKPFSSLTLKDIGFKSAGMRFSEPQIHESVISSYHESRNFPAIEGTSRLSIHLRFGTVSIRKVVATALELNEQWLNELIWREFYMMILFHFPHSAKTLLRNNTMQFHGEIMKMNLKHGVKAKQVILLWMLECANSTQQGSCIIVCG
jgi:deoxyribodipyrimidine photo-lyase